VPVSHWAMSLLRGRRFLWLNATTPRLRHAYTQVKNLLIGQTFSNFQDPDAGPDTLDFRVPAARSASATPKSDTASNSRKDQSEVFC
jgi:hypothetical protein